MYNHIASVFTPEISKKIMDIYIESIKDDKEYAMMVCNNDVHPLDSISDERSSRVQITGNDVNSICNTDIYRIYIHTHGNFPPTPSLMDHQANNAIFKLPDLRYSCIVGTSGVHCIDKSGSELLFPWGRNYFESINDDSVIRIERGDAVFCDMIDGKYDCEISKEGFTKTIGIFNNISMEETIIGEKGSDVMTQVHSPNQILECTIMHNLHNKKSTLNCFKKSDIEIEHSRSTPRRCGYIDVCHPKM